MSQSHKRVDVPEAVGVFLTVLALVGSFVTAEYMGILIEQYTNRTLVAAESMIMLGGIGLNILFVRALIIGLRRPKSIVDVFLGVLQFDVSPIWRSTAYFSIYSFVAAVLLVLFGML